MLGSIWFRRVRCKRRAPPAQVDRISNWPSISERPVRFDLMQPAIRRVARRGDRMRRRDILAFFAGAAVPWPLVAIAQLSERVRVIGVLIGLAENDPNNSPRVAGFQQGLQE